MSNVLWEWIPNVGSNVIVGTAMRPKTLNRANKQINKLSPGMQVSTRCIHCTKGAFWYEDIGFGGVYVPCIYSHARSELNTYIFNLLFTPKEIEKLLKSKLNWFITSCAWLELLCIVVARGFGLFARQLIYLVFTRARQAGVTIGALTFAVRCVGVKYSGRYLTLFAD